MFMIARTRQYGTNLLLRGWLDHLKEWLDIIVAGGGVVSAIGLRGAYTKYRAKKRSEEEFRERLNDALDLWKEIPGRLVSIENTVTSLHTGQRTLASSFSEHKTIVRQMVDETTIPTWETDASGNCIYVNRAYERLTGLNAGELLGLGWRKIVHADDSARLINDWSEAVKQGLSFQTRYRIYDAMGTITHVRVSAKPFHNPMGEIAGYIGTTNPILSSSNGVIHDV